MSFLSATSDDHGSFHAADKRLGSRRATVDLGDIEGDIELTACREDDLVRTSSGRDRSVSEDDVARRHSIALGETQFPSKARTWTVEEAEETMGDRSIVVNLLADLSPAGILPLSEGMSGTGYVPALILLVLFAAAAGYMMYLIARTVELSGAKSYATIWTKVAGPGTAWVPTATVWLVTFGCCLAYACMFGDLFAGCMPAFGLSSASRTACLITLGVFPLLPLCMLKDLSALAPTSLGALAAVIYTVLMMAVRRTDGSYLPGGQYYSPIPEKYLGGSHVWNIGASSLILVNNMAVAYLCHYNGCKYYREYISHRPDRFGRRIANGFSIVTVIFALAMTLGYGTFRGLANGVILNNYSEQDMQANFARVGMGLANVFSFPLMFSGLREANVALLIYINPHNTPTFELSSFQNALSAAMLFVIILVAILVTDAGLVVDLVGAVCGSAIIYVIPSFLFDRACCKFLSGQRYNLAEMLLVRCIGLIGVVLIFAGVAATLLL